MRVYVCVSKVSNMLILVLTHTFFHIPPSYSNLNKDFISVLHLSLFHVSSYQ